MPVYINTDIFSVADLLLTITQCIRCILRQLILGTLSLMNPPHPQRILTSATSGTFRDFGKNDDEKNRFLFLYLRVEPKATFVN